MLLKLSLLIIALFIFFCRQTATTAGGAVDAAEQEHMETDQPAETAEEAAATSTKPDIQKPEDAEAAKAAKKLAKKILNETSRLDPSRVASVPDNRTRRKVREDNSPLMYIINERTTPC